MKSILFFLLLCLSLGANAQIKPESTVPTSEIQPPSGGGSTGSFSREGLNAVRQAGLPIGSLGAIRAYCESATSGGILRVNHPGILPDGEMKLEVVRSSPGYIREIVQELTSTRFSSNLASTQGSVGVAAEFRNLDGLLLMSGSFESTWVGRGEKAGTTFWLSSDEPIRPAIVQVPPIRLPGLESARGVFRNAKGELIFNSPLKVENGNLMYSTNSVGRTGEVILTFRESETETTVVVVDAATGFTRTPEYAAGSVGIHFEGDHWFGQNPPSITLGQNVDIRGAIVRFSTGFLPGSPPIVAGGRSNKGEMPVAAIFRSYPSKPDDLWTVYWEFKDGFANLSLPDGTWELVYILELADLEGIPVVPYWYYPRPQDP